MKNDNIKNILIILVVAIVLACAVLGVVTCINNNKSITDNTGNNKDNNEILNNENSGSQENNDNKQENDNGKDETNFNPYEKYEDVKWCDKNTGIKDTMYLRIEGNYLVFEYSGKSTKYQVKEGTPKSVASYINGGIPMFFLLTEQGDVYEVIQKADFSIDSLAIVESLNAHEIIDMTSSMKSIVHKPIYFLTKEGKLLDFDCYTFEELNLDFVASFGHFYPIYFDKDGHMSYRDYYHEDELLYFPVKEEYNKEAVAKKIFWQSSTIHNDLADENISERYAIITESNKLIYLTDNGDVIIESTKVDFYEIKKVKDEEWGTYRYNIVITMKDEKKITLYDVQDYYYDVENDEIIYFE